MKSLKIKWFNFLSNYYLKHYDKCCDAKRKGILFKKALHYNSMYMGSMGIKPD